MSIQACKVHSQRNKEGVGGQVHEVMSSQQGSLVPTTGSKYDKLNDKKWRF